MKYKKNRPFPFTQLVLSICLLSMGCQPEKTRPNIIVIMADDLGYGELGSYGNDSIHTASLDVLASNGMRFTDFHSNAPVCSPTRAALLTGRYPQKSGLEGVIYVKGKTREVGLDSSETTLAEVLKSAGYKTGVMGKWHLGYNEEFNPIHHGFDEFYGYRSGNVDYHSHYDNGGIYDWYHNTDSIQQEGYSTDLITKNSIDFIKENQNQPFFLFVSHEAPHVPFQGRNDPAYRFPNTEFSYHGPALDKKATYKEMVEVMDEGIGQLMKALSQLELEENTLVFFLSDNGALSAYGNNGGLNGSKGDLLEAGHRVPAIAYWKGKIKPQISQETLMSFDLFPTILSIVSEKSSYELDLDGVDFSSLLFQNENLPARDLFWRYGSQKAVRHSDWKLWLSETDTSLFNLKTDLLEKSNVASSNPKELEKLLNKLNNWEAEMDIYEQKTR